MADERQGLLDAIKAFEAKHGMEAGARDVVTDLRVLERRIADMPQDASAPSEHEKHMRKKMGDKYDDRPKSFDDVAERNAKRVSSDAADDASSKGEKADDDS